MPAARPLTVLPDTEQMLGVALALKMTGLPDAPALALTVVLPPTASVAGAKLIAPMLWLVRPVAKESKDCPPRTSRTALLKAVL